MTERGKRITWLIPCNNMKNMKEKPMNHTFKVTALLAAFLLATCGTANAQTSYPKGPVRLLVPYAPGGGTSYVAQLIAQELSKGWGQNVLVDNRPGGNTVVGTVIALKSPADGQTLLFTTATHVLNEFVTKDLPFHPINDVTPISTLTINNYGMVVHPSVKANSLKEFIALAKARPGEINAGSVGEGGPTALAVHLLNLLADIKTQLVPYKGTSLMLTDLLSGRVHFAMSNLKSLASHVKAGKLRAIAVSGTERSGVLPDVPTFAQAGLPEFSAGNWYGIIGPKGMPRTIVDKIANDLKAVMTAPKIGEVLESEGMDVFLLTPSEFGVLLKTDSDKFRKIVQSMEKK